MKLILARPWLKLLFWRKARFKRVSWLRRMSGGLIFYCRGITCRSWDRASPAVIHRDKMAGITPLLLPVILLTRALLFRYPLPMQIDASANWFWWCVEIRNTKPFNCGCSRVGFVFLSLVKASLWLGSWIFVICWVYGLKFVLCGDL